MTGRLSRQRLVTLVVVCGAVLFVFWQLHPGWLLSRATPTGSDVGGNVWTPGFMRDHLFPHGRITGWAPDWHAGFPVMVFYFPLPTVAIALLGAVLPSEVAFKLVTATGLLGLPVAAWAFGRLAGFRFPAPALMSAASVVFLFDHFQPQPRGGDVISTVRSEFAYSIGLAVALVFLGLIARGLAGPRGHEQSLAGPRGHKQSLAGPPRHRAVGAALLAVVGLCHLYDMTFALVGAAVLFAVRPDRRRLIQLTAIVCVGLLLIGFWLLPFAARLGLTTGGLYPPPSHQLQNIFPFLDTCSERSACRPGQFVTAQVWHLLPVFMLALAAVGLSIVRRLRAGVGLAVLAVLMAAAYPIQPIHRLQSDRFLPFWFLCIYLLAALGLSELVHEAQALRSRRSRRYAQSPGRGDGTLVAPLVAMVSVVLLVGLPFRSLPAPLHVTDLDQVRVSLRYAYAGYEGRPAHREYEQLVRTVDRLGRARGCGRAFAEADPSSLFRYGSVYALTLFPYWTHGCITSFNEAYYHESSASSLYERLMTSELTKDPIRVVRDLPYRSLDLGAGVEHLQLWGVRYYLAVTPEAKRQADARPELTRRARAGPWTVYEVADAPLVAPLSHLPAVVRGIGGPGRSWNAIGVAFHQRPRSGWDVPLAAAGPATWPRTLARPRPGEPLADGRIAFGTTVEVDAPRRPVTPARVSRVVTGDDRVSFDVDRVGSPVLVKVSYFPNWKATGADGPWRVTPNFMVVVPTARHVSLHYGRTAVDDAGLGLSLIGVIGLGGLAWLDHRMGAGPEPEPVPASRPPREQAPPAVRRRARSKRRR